VIVRKNLKVSVIIKLSGSRVALALGWSLLLVGLYELGGFTWVAVPTTAMGFMATALAIFLGFHNNSSYDRWWEARKQWGQLVNSSRTFARQVKTFVGDPTAHRELIHRQIAFVHALRLHLRKQPELLAEVAPLLPDGELALVKTSSNVPLAIMQRQADRLQQLRTAGALGEFPAVQLDATLTDLANVQGACERIKNTPLPRQYEYYTRLFVYFFVLLLPATMVETLGWRTPLFTVPTSFLFFALEGVAAVNEDPFENRIQDTPMSALSRTIEINLRELNGETDLPPPLTAVDGYLW
jgi:ion channel-forming bestrophin family protein